MEKLKKLVELCKAQVIVSINPHKNYYQTVMEYMEEFERMEDVSEEILQEMSDKNTIIEIQYYPNTPTGFKLVYHYDIEKAMDEALQDMTG